MYNFIDGKWTAIFSIGGSVMAFFLGVWNLPLQILMGAILADYVCGTMKAFYLGEVSSRVGYKGLIKKVGILFMVVVGQFADMILGLNILRNAICLAYAVNELWSICENVSAMGVYIPPFIKDKLVQIKVLVENVDDKKE